jgi:Ca2+-transporting ATPase
MSASPTSGDLINEDRIIIALGPLALLWVNFANDVPMPLRSVSTRRRLGKPRRVSAPVLTRTQWIRITITGLLSPLPAPGARVIGEDSYTDGIGATMLLVTASLAHIVGALSVRDEFGTFSAAKACPVGANSGFTD